MMYGMPGHGPKRAGLEPAPTKDYMKSFTHYLWFNTKNRQEFVNITPQVEEAVAKSGIKEGLCLVNAMHITSSVFTHD